MANVTVEHFTNIIEMSTVTFGVFIEWIYIITKRGNAKNMLRWVYLVFQLPWLWWQSIYTCYVQKCGSYTFYEYNCIALHNACACASVPSCELQMPTPNSLFHHYQLCSIGVSDGAFFSGTIHVWSKEIVRSKEIAKFTFFFVY